MAGPRWKGRATSHSLRHVNRGARRLHPPRRDRRRAAGQLRRRRLFHRPHPHAVARRDDCPKNARGSDAACTIELDPRYAAALDGIATCTHLLVLYLMDQARRDLLVQAPRHGEPARHLRAALAGAPEPDRDERGAARCASRARAHGGRPRLPRRHAADRPQAVFRLRRIRARGRGGLEPEGSALSS